MGDQVPGSSSPVWPVRTTLIPNASIVGTWCLLLSTQDPQQLLTMTLLFPSLLHRLLSNWNSATTKPTVTNPPVTTCFEEPIPSGSVVFFSCAWEVSRLVEVTHPEIGLFAE